MVGLASGPVGAGAGSGSGSGTRAEARVGADRPRAGGWVGMMEVCTELYCNMDEESSYKRHRQ